MGYEIFDLLRKERGVSIAEVARATNIEKGMFTHWKKGDYSPKSDKRKRIADYFGVTLEYLDTGETSDPVLRARQQMSDEVRTLADLASKADPEQVKLATTFLKTIMESK